MAQQGRSALDTAYANSAGTFADNTTRLISEGDLRTFSDDIFDSFVNITDDVITGPTPTQQTEFAAKVVAPIGIGTFFKYGSITSSNILTANASPVTIVSAPGSGLVLIPIKFFVHLDYNSVAYATNTTFNFVLNTTLITNDNSTILPGTANRYTSLTAIDFDTTTDLTDKALFFKVQTGNPTAGNSIIYYSCIYRVVPTLAIA